MRQPLEILVPSVNALPRAHRAWWSASATRGGLDLPEAFVRAIGRGLARIRPRAGHRAGRGRRRPPDAQAGLTPAKLGISTWPAGGVAC